MKDMWIYCGNCPPFLEKDLAALIEKAKSLTAEFSQVCALVVSDESPEKLSCLSWADRIIWFSSNGIRAEFLAAYARRFQPEIILFPSVIQFSRLAAEIAACLDTGLCADCTDLSVSDGNLIMHRPAFGGGVEADIICTARPQMATVRRQIFSATPTAGSPVLEVIPVPKDAILYLPNFHHLPSEHLKSVSNSEILIAGGLGVGSRKNFKILEHLASLIGAQIGASRAAVDAGYADWTCQIGQTGRQVHPKLYLAFGISGSIQHIAGMYRSGFIISVNTDPHAPIFDYSDLAIVSDWKVVAEWLIVRLLSGQ